MAGNGWSSLIKNLDCQWCRMKIARTSSIRHGMMWWFLWVFWKNAFFCSWERRADPITPWVRHAYKFLRLLSQNGGGDFLDWKEEIECSTTVFLKFKMGTVPPNCYTSWDLREPTNPFHYPPRIKHVHHTASMPIKTRHRPNALIFQRSVIRISQVEEVLGGRTPTYQDAAWTSRVMGRTGGLSLFFGLKRTRSGGFMKLVLKTWNRVWW